MGFEQEGTGTVKTIQNSFSFYFTFWLVLLSSFSLWLQCDLHKKRNLARQWLQVFQSEHELALAT